MEAAKVATSWVVVHRVPRLGKPQLFGNHHIVFRLEAEESWYSIRAMQLQVWKVMMRSPHRPSQRQNVPRCKLTDSWGFNDDLGLGRAWSRDGLQVVCLAVAVEQLTQPAHLLAIRREGVCRNATMGQHVWLGSPMTEFCTGVAAGTASSMLLDMPLPATLRHRVEGFDMPHVSSVQVRLCHYGQCASGLGSTCSDLGCCSRRGTPCMNTAAPKARQK
jgi:hypothetical protein